jgi:hypothetical protein
MATTRQAVRSVGRARFELDRLELVDGQRYELEGRWFDVRGRRFMRPTLMIVEDKRPVRLLADLADKPWPAEEGEPWRASFPYPHASGELLEAELTVGPDVTIILPVPGGRRRPPDRPTPEQARAAAEKARATARIDELLGELSQAVHERDAASALRDQLAAELEALRQERDEIAAQRDAARRESDELTSELKAARRARGTALRARAAALKAADAAAEAREASLADRGAAVTAGNRADTERNAALVQVEQAEGERDSALARCDQARAERNSALAARDDALAERDALSRANAQLKADLSNQIASHGAALVMRRATRARTTQAPPAFERYPGLLTRALIVIALLAIAVVLLIVLHAM